VLLDTCGLIWWTLDPDKISPKGQALIKKSESLYVSAISIAELGIKIKKKKLQLPLPLREYIYRLHQSQITILPVTEWTLLDSLELKWAHTDPADRIIVATAKAEKWPIVTTDKMITAYYKNTVK